MKSEPKNQKSDSVMLSVRMPENAVQEIDEQRCKGLFPRSRSEWLRDAVQSYLQTDSVGGRTKRR